MAFTSAVIVSGEQSIDHALHFQRLPVVYQSADISIDAAMKYELCPYPPSLFEARDIMRKAEKPQLADYIYKHTVLFQNLHMPFWIRHLTLTSMFFMVTLCSIDLNGTKAIHAIQSQMRMLLSPLETMVQLSLFSTDMMARRPKTTPTNAANEMRCPELLMSRQNRYSQKQRTSSETQPQTGRP